MTVAVFCLTSVTDVYIFTAQFWNPNGFVFFFFQEKKNERRCVNLKKCLLVSFMLINNTRNMVLEQLYLMANKFLGEMTAVL